MNGPRSLLIKCVIFRYNTRKMNDGERADIALKGITGKRLTYRRADAIAA